MKIFYIPTEHKQGRFVASHADTQDINPSVYGDNVRMFVADVIERIGPKPDSDQIDMRPIVVPEIGIEAERNSARTEILEMISAAANSLLSAYPQSEVLSWSTKESAANAFMSNKELTDAESAILDAEVATGGGTKSDLCLTILVNAERFARASGALSGIRTSAMQKLADAGSVKQLLVIVGDTRSNIALALNPPVPPKPPVQEPTPETPTPEPDPVEPTPETPEPEEEETPEDDTSGSETPPVEPK